MEKLTVRFRWLLPGLLGWLLLASPAIAAKLQFWRFDPNQNRLDFTTDDGVQPRAQLVTNPTRLVIDLPGIRLDRPQVNQPFNGAVRSLRIAQFDRDTTRIVIELAPGYTLDPEQIRVRGTTANQWAVQLPAPQFVGLPTPPSTVGSPPTPPPLNPSRQPPLANAATVQLQGIQVTPDGFFVRTSGRPLDVDVERADDQIRVSLMGVAISPSLTQRNLLINRYGVRRIQVTQAQGNPPVTRLILNVSDNAPSWQASISELGGVVLVPSGGIASTQAPSGLPIPGRAGQESNQVATIQAVNLDSSGRQLVIRANQPLKSSAGWDRASGFYRITLSGARLAPRVTGPQLNPNSPLLRVRLRQEGNNVVILLQPAAGTQFGVLNQLSPQMLALQVQRGGAPLNPPPISSSPPPVVPGGVPTNPRVPNGRIVVIIDPGHGGPDPGAIGIGGLQEKGIVLDIGLQVAAILQQNGIQVIVTRPDDRDLDLEPRVQMAERANANLFVSIHANSINLSRQDVSGIETYYYGNDRLAQVIHRSIIQGTGAQDRGVRRARFYVLRKTSMPATLLEVGFVTGREDASRLSTPAYRSQMAQAIARGILQYIRQNF